jgi:hypothetical protein
MSKACCSQSVLRGRLALIHRRFRCVDSVVPCRRVVGVRTEASAPRSHGKLRRVRALRVAPIDPFQQHRSLCATQVHNPALGVRPDEHTELQALCEKAQPIAIPPKQLHSIPPAGRERRTADPRMDLPKVAVARSPPSHQSPCACRSRRTQASCVLQREIRSLHAKLREQSIQCRNGQRAAKSNALACTQVNLYRA